MAGDTLNRDTWFVQSKILSEPFRDIHVPGICRGGQFQESFFV